MIPEITSLKDERIQLARSLNTQKGRAATGKFLIEGREALEWARAAGVVVDFILVGRAAAAAGTGWGDVPVFLVSDGLLRKVTETSHPVPLVAVGNAVRASVRADFVVVLDDVRDYGNIGTIVRTCRAFGVDTVIGTSADFDLFHRKTVDASRGTVFSTRAARFENPRRTIDFLREKGYRIVTTSPQGEQLQSLVALGDAPVALVVGNETVGAAAEFMAEADLTVQIPMYGVVESLNVGVATGISIYELKLKQVLGMIEKKIKSTLGREINVAGALIQEVLDAELKKVSNLSSRQLVFLMVLKCDAVMRLVDAQKQFGIPDGEIESFFAPLHAGGFVRRETDDTLVITVAGEETIAKLWTVIENAETMILADFSAEERRELLRLVQRLQRRCAALISGS